MYNHVNLSKHLSGRITQDLSKYTSGEIFETMLEFIGCWSDPVGCDPSHLKGLCAQKPKPCIVKFVRQDNTRPVKIYIRRNIWNNARIHRVLVTPNRVWPAPYEECQTEKRSKEISGKMSGYIMGVRMLVRIHARIFARMYRHRDSQEIKQK